MTVIEQVQTVRLITAHRESRAAILVLCAIARSELIRDMSDRMTLKREITGMPLGRISLRRSALILFMLGVGASLSHTQTSFQRTYGDTWAEEGSSVQQTSDGGYIVAGSTTSFGAGYLDVYLIKTDTSGDTLWTRTYGGTNSDDGSSVQQTSDSGYIVAGVTRSFGAGVADVYLIKTNSSGDTLWTRTYGGASGEEGFSVQQTSDGGYIVAGSTNSFGAGSFDVYLIKTNSSGDTLWTRTFGNTSDDVGNSVRQTSDGGYIVTGITGLFGPSSGDLYLIKTNPSGDTIWTRAYGGTDSDHGFSVEQTSDGGYVVAGSTSSFGTRSSDMYLIKTNSSGDTLWTRIYGGPGIELGYSVQQTSDGGYIVAGSTNSFGAGSFDVYLIKTNSSGDALWTRTYGGADADEASSVHQASDGGYIVAGYANSDGWDWGDLYLIKTPANGVVPVHDDRGSTPAAIVLLQNYPNPFNPVTVIGYRIPVSSRVIIKVYDVLGQTIATLIDEMQEAGNKSVEWNADGVSSGVYFYRLQAGVYTQTKKLILFR